MDFGFTEEQLGFRQEVSDFCLNAPRYPLVDFIEESFFSPEYYRELAARGWIGLHWPKEYGGQGRTWVDLVTFNEQMGYRAAPIGEIYYGTVGLFGDFCCAHGSEEQKRDYLPRITRGEIRFARAYTEPDAGYDLAAVQTSARADGDDYIINGHKHYTTGGNTADYLFLLARTDPEARNGKGLSFFIVDRKTPGITVSAMWSIAMRTNEVFFEDVRVPGRNLIGEAGRALEYFDDDPRFRYETCPGYDLGGTKRLFERVVRQVKQDSSPGPRQRAQARQMLAEIAIDIEVSRLLTYRLAWMRDAGLFPRYEVYVHKLFQAELDQRLSRSATEIFGLLGQLDMGAKYAPLRGMMPIMLRTTLIQILPGSHEILRSAIARKGLQLPG